MENNNKKIEDLIAERTRINKEISALKRKEQKKNGIKFVRYPTGLMGIRVLAKRDDWQNPRFVTIASSWDIEELLDRAKYVANTINEYCQKNPEEIKGEWCRE